MIQGYTYYIHTMMNSFGFERLQLFMTPHCNLSEVLPFINRAMGIHPWLTEIQNKICELEFMTTSIFLLC